MFKIETFGTAGKVRIVKTLPPSDTHINIYIYLEVESNKIRVSQNVDEITYTTVEANATIGTTYNMLCVRWKYDTVNNASLIGHNRSILTTFKYDTQLDLISDRDVTMRLSELADDGSATYLKEFILFDDIDVHDTAVTSISRYLCDKYLIN